MQSPIIETINFPIIKTIDDLLAHVGDKEYIKVINRENGTKVVCYQISDNDSFTNMWEKECRGITFDADGNILSRPLHKFFNLNEREETSLKKLDRSKIKAIYPKLDGSMISSYVLNNKVVFKTKKSETSDVALKLTEFISNYPEYNRFCLDMGRINATPIFEFTAPDNRIVVEYKESKLTLLHIRDNVTGKYLDVDFLSSNYDIDVIKPFCLGDKEFDNILNNADKTEGVEGYIIKLDNDDMIKVKTLWYLNLHKAFSFFRYRDVANIVIEDKLDDLRAFINMSESNKVGLTPIIEDVEKKINNKLLEIEAKTEELFKEIESKFFKNNIWDYKSASKYINEKIANNNDKMYSRFVFNKMRGKENDYRDFYKKHLLKDSFSLDQIPFSGVDSINTKEVISGKPKQKNKKIERRF